MREYVINDGSSNWLLLGESLAAVFADVKAEVLGSYDAQETTYWVELSVMREDEDGNELESYYEKIAIDPAEPDCSEGEHDWQSPHAIVGGCEQNPGVRANGGGVIITECCMHCGCKRESDSWAQDRETGEQGLDSVWYDAAHFTLSGELELDAG